MWAQSAAEVGKIIAAARRHHKLTQAELAQAIGATQTWVSEIENGKETAQIGKVLRALSHLGVRLQTGVVRTYALAFLLGVVGVLCYLAVRF